MAATLPQDPDNAELAGLSYEQARDELVAIVARLESGHVDLEDSMRLWERGERLAQHCARWLDGAQARLVAQESTSSGQPVDAVERPGDGTA